MADSTYLAAKVRFATGELDWEAEDLRVLLLDAAGSYTFDASHQYVIDLVPGTNELTATNYVRKTLDGAAVTGDAANNRALLTADNVVYTDLGDGDVSQQTVQAAVIYIHVSDDADSLLVRYLDSVGGVLTGADATMAWDATGVMRLI